MPLDPQIFDDPPSVQKRLLRQILRDQREHAQLTQKQAADNVVWSLTKLIRIENGVVPVTPADVRLLLLEYDTDTDLRQEVVELAKLARRPDPWAEYQNYISPSYQALLDTESAAGVVLGFQPMVVPGLLQTEEYARALLDQLGVSSQRAEKVWEIRAQRQEILQAKDRPDFNFLIGEAALSYGVGSAQVMRRQLARLDELGEELAGNSLLQVMPFSLGAYPGWDRAFTLHRMRVPSLPDFLYLENSDEDFSERGEKEVVDKYFDRFWDLWERARRKADGQELVAQLHVDLENIRRLRYS